MLTKERLKTLRQGFDLTQAEMASKIGLSHRQYQEIENGRSSIRLIHRLAIKMVIIIMEGKHDPIT